MLAFRKELRLLNNSVTSNFQKLDRARKLHRQFSRLSEAFSVLPIPFPPGKPDFFNSLNCFPNIETGHSAALLDQQLADRPAESFSEQLVR
jgi:hypothetical protein